MIGRRCDVTVEVLIGWGEAEERCSNEASWTAAGHHFCDGCLREALEGRFLRSPIFPLFEDDAVDEAAE